MMIVKKQVGESRADAVRLTRTEKMGMILLAHAATTLDDLQADFSGRLGMVENGAERLKKLSEDTDSLLNDLRATVPQNQRMHLQNTAMDYEMRLAPKAQPSETNVIMDKEEFREIVECARAKCVDCTMDDEECSNCKLFQLLTVVLPMDDYHYGAMCPYNLAGWGN